MYVGCDSEKIVNKHLFRPTEKCIRNRSRRHLLSVSDFSFVLKREYFQNLYEFR